jgi:hypothetical protein
MSSLRWPDCIKKLWLIAQTNFGSLFIPICILFCCNGCFKDTTDVVGIVGSEEGIAESVIFARDYRFGQAETPVANAVVFLSFDEEGRRKIKGYETHTDKEGKYRIKTDGIPPGAEPTKYYYFLHVQKPGYEPFVGEISIQAFSHYVRNKVILKPIKKK